MIIKVSTFVLAAALSWWPFHHKKAETLNPPIQFETQGHGLVTVKCILNDYGLFFYSQNGDSWGISAISCMDAVNDWQHTKDNFYLTKEDKL